MTKPKFLDSQTIYINIAAFRKSPNWMIIDWTTAHGALTKQCMVVTAHRPCHEACMAGILIKIRGRVWRLTGRFDRDRSSYEAQWPD